MKFGLIGYPLTHSFSKKYFTEKFINLGLTNPNFSYENYPLENVEDLIPLLRSDLFGLNVTIPYKSLVIPFLDEIDPVALQIGAVNTLVKTSTNTWKGFNTDVTAFRLSLENWMTGTPLPKQALILGTGGASKAISHALFSIGIKPSTVSRSGKSNYVYEDLNGDLIKSYPLIINATPLGMFPNIDSCPDIPYASLTGEHWLYDVVYNPTNTLFLTRGERVGAHTKNGLDMLHLQAEQAWLIWKSYGRF